MHRIVLIHAVTPAMAPVADAFRRLWPKARTVNVLDDSLSIDVAEAGGLTPAITGRMKALADYGVAAGADGILFTCSAFGAAIDAAKRDMAVPVLKPNEAMIEEALGAGPRIAALATFAPTIGSLERELEAAAEARGLAPETDLRHVPGALEALNAGRGNEHDALIAAAAEDLGDCDALMLAQFSMVRARGAIAEVPGRRVLTAPEAAVMKLRSLLGA
jgi:hypothetical protein